MKIAVMICGLVFDSQKATMKGIERKCRDLKDTCSVFCCHMSVAQNETYTTGEFKIFELPDLSEFDGIVFVRNTFPDNEIETKLRQRIIESGVPCVCLDYYDENFVNICSDESGSMEALVEHMVTEHECKKFYYVGGIKGYSDNNVRYNAFRSVLAKHDLPFCEERHVVYGDFEYEKGVLAADYFYNLDEDMADCIVCANDQMAVGLYMQLKKLGVRVPKNVKITGVDYDFVSRVVSPRLTTIKRQQYQKGLRAIDILHNYEKYEKGTNIVLPIAISIGETCGCHGVEENHSDVDDALAIDRYKQSELTQMIKRMTADMTSKRDRAELIEEMKRYAEEMKPRELYLCTNVRPEVEIEYSTFSDVNLMGISKEQEEFSDTMENVIACINGNNVESGQTFSRKELLPPLAKGGREGVTYYYFPIHYANRNFGYVAVGESGEIVRNDFLPNWVTLVSNSFENTRKIDLMEKMIDALDRMWIYDTLTGIYNRAGFYKLSEPIVNEAVEKEIPLCIIFMDVDGLKIINDKYGHDEGDNLIRDMATILKDMKRHGEIIMRYGGDEFVLMAENYTQQQAMEFVTNMEQAMIEFNKDSKRPYVLDASIGFCITVIKDKEELSDLIEQADHAMYKKKYVKKALGHS